MRWRRFCCDCGVTLTASPMSDAEVAGQIKACIELIPREEEGPWVAEQAKAEDAASALASHFVAV